MIHENFTAFKWSHLHLNPIVSRLDAENVAVALKLRNANIQKAYCKNNFIKKILLKFFKRV